VINFCFKAGSFAAYGASSGNTFLSIAMGLTIGVAVGAIFDFVKNKK
jgi:hypothetical protein